MEREREGGPEGEREGESGKMGQGVGERREGKREEGTRGRGDDVKMCTHTQDSRVETHLQSHTKSQHLWRNQPIS